MESSRIWTEMWDELRPHHDNSWRISDANNHFVQNVGSIFKNGIIFYPGVFTDPPICCKQKRRKKLVLLGTKKITTAFYINWKINRGQKTRNITILHILQTVQITSNVGGRGSNSFVFHHTATKKQKKKKVFFAGNNDFHAN